MIISWSKLFIIRYLAICILSPDSFVSMTDNYIMWRSFVLSSEFLPASITFFDIIWENYELVKMGTLKYSKMSWSLKSQNDMLGHPKADMDANDD